MIKITVENMEKIIVPSFENTNAIIFHLSERHFWPSLPTGGGGGVGMPQGGGVCFVPYFFYFFK
jgi:hypothetical protein